jgi:ankyrin repeat protein
LQLGEVLSLQRAIFRKVASSELIRFIDLKALDVDLVRNERTLISLSSPINPFKTAGHAHDPVIKLDTFQKWLNSTGPPILYVYGTDAVQEASEQIFYAIDDRMRTVPHSPYLIFYFSFDRWDSRRNSINAMLSTFLAQNICHHTSSMSQWVEILFEQLNEEHGWTDLDTINWFEIFRIRGHTHNVSLVINYFDECDEASRNTFLAFVKRRFSGCEITWKIVITSRKPGAFADELSDWPSIDLANIESGVMQQRSRNVENDIARLIKFRPDVAPLEDLLRKELVPLVDIDPLARHIVCEQARLQKDWPEETSLQKVFCLVDRPSDDHWSLESILDRVLRRIPEQYQVKKLLAWLLYGIRQLTIWELASVMFLGSDQDQGEAYPGPSTIQDLILRCETWLAGIVEIQHNEIRIQHSRLRDIFMTPGTATGQLYLWHEVQEFANFEITKTCLEFLSRTSVQGVMEQMYQSPGSDLIEVSNFPDRENLCSYAVRAWPQHYLLIPDGLNPSKLLDKFLRSAVMTTWPKAYWALSNPVTRPSQCLETLYPTFVGLGLSSYSLKPQNDEDLASALVEAARNGWVNALTDLLHQTAYSKTALMDALVAAAAGGVQQIMLDIIDQIVANNKHDTVQLEWPPVLLYRAGWLDLDKFAERLLELGCAPEPGDPKARKSLSTPLFQAVRFGHLSTVRVLLKYKADVRFRTIWERQPLQWSIYFGHAHVAKALVEEGHAELEATDDEGFTALYHAARLGYYPAVEALLQLGADPQMGKTAKTSHPGWLPLVTAASLGHRKSVLALLERGANPNMKGPWGYGTPLRYAAVNSEREISSLLLEYGADPNSPLIQPPLLIDVVIDSTLLMLEKAGMLALLIENKALVDASDPRGMTALMHAVRRGDELLVKCLLEHDADVDLCNEDGEAPLHFAAQKDREDIIKLLLQKDPDVNCRNQARRGYTPLILGCGNEKIVRLLLEKGADPEVPSNEGVTPLMFAASNGHSDAAKLLLEHKATVDSEVDRDKARSPGWTAASFAAKLGHGHILRLLANAGADLNHETKEGVRPIHLAAATDSLHPLLEFRKRFDIDQAEPENGDTALHYVVKKSAPIKNVKCLVNSGANLNVQNKNGDTPLTLAANYGKQEVVSIFLAEKDLDINLASPCHGGAVHQACQMSHIDIVKLLVEHGADVNYAVPGMPGTPLQAACLEYPYTIGKQLVKFLIASGADVKKQGGLLGCALSAAALMNSTELVRLFLDEGAMTDTCDGMGRVPIHFSAERGIDTFKIILDAGGDIRARDKIHRTALHWAAQHARLQVVELLLPALGSEAVDETDIDGWTPLCWAARGPEGWLSRDVAEGRADQVKIIRLLLKHGADRFTQGTIGEQKWSPLKIARYSDANAETLKLLERGLGDGSDDSKNAQATSENDSDDMTKPGLAKAFTCDYCMWVSRLYPPVLRIFSRRP